jgi:hypothetical protein
MMHSIAFNDDSYHINNKDVDEDFVLVQPVTPTDPIAAFSVGLNDDDNDDESSYDYCDDVFEKPLSVDVQLGSDVNLQPVEEDDNTSFLGPQAMDEDEEEVLLEMAMSSSIMNQLSHDDMDELHGLIDHDSTSSDIPTVKEGESLDGADSKSTLAEESAASMSGVNVSNVTETKLPAETEINNTVQSRKNTGSRLTNKKRRKQIKLSKKAAAAAAAAAALAKISTHPVSPIRRNKKIAPTVSLQQQQQRKGLPPQVACATQEIAAFRDGMIMQSNTSKMVR